MAPNAPANELTLQQAADLLDVSRAYVQRLLEEGMLPSTVVGRGCRIPLDDVVAFKRQRDQERRAALRELAQVSEDLGLYRPTPIPDDPPPGE
jgi:excisionase family DNA binding protein